MVIFLGNSYIGIYFTTESIMTQNQIINCNVFSDEEIIDARDAAIKRLKDLIAELAYLMNNPTKNGLTIIYCENQIQSGKDFIANMDEILKYRKNESNG